MKKFLFLSLFLIFAGSTLCQASSKISGEHKATMTAATTTLMAGGAVATMRQLEAEANDHLSNYSGDDDYEGYSGYTGANDDFLDFGG
ncbi:MAG TPA: hypothetical protein PKC41_09570, partial [Chitinophagaceae bacterium]|nr:hypothetical protein [Chitinophagaceae bacterium]